MSHFLFAKGSEIAQGAHLKGQAWMPTLSLTQIQSKGPSGILFLSSSSQKPSLHIG